METNNNSWTGNWLQKLRDQGDSLYGVGGLEMPSMNLNSQTGLELTQEGKQGKVKCKKYLDDIIIIKILWWNFKKKSQSA